MPWIKARYAPGGKRVFVDGEDIGNVNKLKFIGEDGSYRFDLGPGNDYKPASMLRDVTGSTRLRPLILEFEPKP